MACSKAPVLIFPMPTPEWHVFPKPYQGITVDRFYQNLGCLPGVRRATRTVPVKVPRRIQRKVAQLDKKPFNLKEYMKCVIPGELSHKRTFAISLKEFYYFKEEKQRSAA